MRFKAVKDTRSSTNFRKLKILIESNYKKKERFLNSFASDALIKPFLALTKSDSLFNLLSQ